MATPCPTFLCTLASAFALTVHQQTTRPCPVPLNPLSAQPYAHSAPQDLQNTVEQMCTNAEMFIPEPQSLTVGGDQDLRILRPGVTIRGACWGCGCVLTSWRRACTLHTLSMHRRFGWWSCVAGRECPRTSSPKHGTLAQQPAQ